MTRLPIPGGDVGSWGQVLNDYLQVEHNADGTLKNVARLSDLAAKYTKPGSGIPSSDLTASVQTSLSKADTALQSAPVTQVAGRTGSITLTKADVGLTNVDNTTDLNKPISTATQTAIDAKADTTTVTALTTRIDSSLKADGTLKDQSVTRAALEGSVAAALSLDAETKRSLALRRWFAALSSRDTAPVDIAIMGDSITEGFKLSTAALNLPGALIDRLRTALPTVGVTGGRGYIPAIFTQTPPSDYPVVSAGGAFNNAGWGLRSRIFTGSGHKCVYSFTGATSVGILHYKNGASGTAGSFSYKVDSTSAIIVDCKVDPVQDFNEIVVAIPDSGVHTITVEWISGAVIFNGFVHYSGDEGKGIRVWNGGHTGYRSVDFVPDTVRRTYLARQISKIQPALVVLELGANDFTLSGTSRSSAAYKANLQEIVSIVLASAVIKPSVVLVPIWERDRSVAVSPWSEFVAANYDIAASDDSICVCDIGKRVKPVTGETGTASGLLRADEGSRPTHPTDAGVRFMAEALSRFLLPR